MRCFNQKALGIAMVFLVLAYLSCTSKPESEISQTEQQTQESSMATNEQEEAESSTTAQSPEQPPISAQETAQAKEPSGQSGVVTITGTVENGLDGVIISAEDGDYAVSGKDLSDMEGMTVRVTGALKESGGLRTIEATEVVIVN
jgi:Na+-transporting methylmalonyl-CoA/oxaloacetate decarboxylase gamma subunit